MHCRICDHPILELAVDLGEQPWANHFLTEAELGSEPRYPLRVVVCTRCHCAQLDYTVAKETMFGDHTYLSGVTRSLSDHFSAIAAEVTSALGPRSRPSVLDIGSNDGTQLKHFAGLGYDVLGVEASRQSAAIAQSAGILTVHAFFNEPLARSIGRKFDVINAAGVFFHLEELHSVTEGIRESLARDGIFLVQFLYMKSIMDNCAFDQIYHEHLLYYTLETISTLLERHGLEMYDAWLSPIHGGSIIAYVTHRGRLRRTARLETLIAAEQAAGINNLSAYLDFAGRVIDLRRENLSFLDRARAAGKTVWGLGAPVKGNTLLNYFQIDRSIIACLTERNPLRRGLYSPGTHIPVVMEDDIAEEPDMYYVLAWNFRTEILQRNRHKVDRGIEFYFPIQPPGV